MGGLGAELHSVLSELGPLGSLEFLLDRKGRVLLMIGLWMQTNHLVRGRCPDAMVRKWCAADVIGNTVR